MFIKLGIESFLHWSGVDHIGRFHSNRYRGSMRSLRSHLHKQNIILTHVKREFHLRKKQHTSIVLNEFTEDLASILATGIHLTDALTLLKYRYASTQLSQIIAQLLQALHAGSSFSTALNQHPNFFKATYIQLITAAEQTNQLPAILMQLAHQMKLMLQLKNKVKKALIYPLTVLVFTLFISIGLIVFALPQFQRIFENFNATLPTATNMLLSISAFLQRHAAFVIVSSLCVILILYYLSQKSTRFHTVLHTLFLHTPWIGTVYRHRMLADWSYSMNLCVRAKLPLRDCLLLAQNSISANTLKKAYLRLPDLITAGHTLHDALTRITLFDHSALYLIQLGETSHTLEQALERLSAHTFKQVEQALESLSKWLEPVIMLILALITGGLIISLYLPIFKIGSIL